MEYITRHRYTLVPWNSKEKYSPTLMDGDIGPLPQGALGLLEETLAPAL